MNNLIKGAGGLFLLAVGATVATKGIKVIGNALSETAKSIGEPKVTKVIVIKDIIGDLSEKAPEAVEKVAEVVKDAADTVQS